MAYNPIIQNALDAMKKENEVQKQPELYPDGKYRWIHERSYYKIPLLMIFIMKSVAVLIALVWMVIVLLNLGEEDYWKGGGFKNTTIIFAIIMAVTMILIVVGYLIYAKKKGGKYFMIHEMDEEGIRYITLPTTTDLAGAEALLEPLSDTKDPDRADDALAEAASIAYSEFRKVKVVRAYPEWSVVRLKEKLISTEVYLSDDHYRFVLEYIASHVSEKAKVIGMTQRTQKEKPPVPPDREIY